MGVVREVIYPDSLSWVHLLTSSFTIVLHPLHGFSNHLKNSMVCFGKVISFAGDLYSWDRLFCPYSILNGHSKFSYFIQLVYGKVLRRGYRYCQFGVFSTVFIHGF